MHDDVRNYYGETLQSSKDLQTSACCTLTPPSAYIRDIQNRIHSDVRSRYYGCGLVIPQLLEALSILDLGSGSGQDAYTLSALVGEHGKVIGVDMTDEQLAIANQYRDYHAQQFAHSKPNTTFLKGQLEQLNELPLEPNSLDLIVSNCVINLCVDKQAVLNHAFQLLKPGGEMYFSDVYADRRIPESLRNDPVLYGECLSGAFYWNDFLASAKRAGFQDPRLVEDRRLEVHNEELEAKLGNIRFYSATYRLFKLENLEPSCEDYGQAVIYKGSIPHCKNTFYLDKHHVIEAGKVFPVCGNSYRMLHDTRFQSHFEFIGEGKRHFGIFQSCGTHIPFDEDTMEGGCC